MSGFVVIAAHDLPDNPLDAASQFHARIVPPARAGMAGGDVVLSFAPAGHAHRGWRLAAVQELAREAAPGRVNAVEGAASAGVLAYLARAPGVTGQILRVDDNLPQSA